MKALVVPCLLATKGCGLHRLAAAAWLAMLASGPARTAGPPLSAATRSADAPLLARAREEEPAVIRALQDVVSIESGSDDPSGLQKLADYYAQKLRAMGATTRTVAATNGTAPGVLEGTWKGTGKLRVTLLGHLDTVYRAGILDLEPYRREGNQLYGPGIADDKGGIAVLLHALNILRRAHWQNYAKLTVLINADEEIGSPGSGTIIAAQGSQSDVVLSYEPSPAKAVAGSEGVLLKAAGIASIQLVVTGRATHAGAAPEEGRNALLELAYQLVQTRDVAQSVSGTQMNWTTANGGRVRNQIPEQAEANSDIRLTEPGAAEQLLAALSAKVSGSHLIPDTRDELSLHISRPMFVAGERGLELAKLAETIYSELGAGNLAEESNRDMPSESDGRSLLMIPGTTGGTDAGFAASSGKAAVLEGLGLAGWGYHAKNEYIEIDSIVPRLYLTSRMLMELGKRANSGTHP
jgi:glutamate carboxypeptidase